MAVGLFHIQRPTSVSSLLAHALAARGEMRGGGSPRGAGLRAVVVAARNDHDFSGCSRIDETMLFVDPAGPVAGEIAAERFRLSDAFKRGAEDVLDEQLDAVQQPAVMFLKSEVVRPRGGREAELHGSSRSFSSDWPASASAIDRRRWAALAGFARR